jgi:hypothetical protein
MSLRTHPFVLLMEFSSNEPIWAISRVHIELWYHIFGFVTLSYLKHEFTGDGAALYVIQNSQF